MKLIFAYLVITVICLLFGKCIFNKNVFTWGIRFLNLLSLSFSSSSLSLLHFHNFHIFDIYYCWCLSGASFSFILSFFFCFNKYHISFKCLLWVLRVNSLMLSSSSLCLWLSLSLHHRLEPFFICVLNCVTFLYSASSSSPHLSLPLLWHAFNCRQTN